MSATDDFSSIEAMYQRILALTKVQEEALVRGRYDRLPAILSEKAETLDRAQQLTASLGAESGTRRNQSFQEMVRRVGAILGEMVEIEDRCREMVARAQPTPSRAAAVAAYGKPGLKR